MPDGQEILQGVIETDRPVKPAMLRGWRCRCPNCGTGPMLRGYLKVRDTCPVCGEDFHHQRADDGPAYLTILIVGHLMAPLILWLAGGILWFVAMSDRRGIAVIVGVAVLSAVVHYAAPPLLGIPKLAVSDYKGVSYARKFPDAVRTYERASPFGYLEVYSSSYLHFAPGQSDNAAFNVPKMPSNAYLGLYIDSEGPAGIIKDLPAEQTAVMTATQGPIRAAAFDDRTSVAA